jgi:hypothetical protein
MAGEKRLQQFIQKKLTGLGCLCYKVSADYRRGWPDLTVTPPGKPTFYIEVKNPNGRGHLSRWQDIMIARIRAQGTAVYVVDSKEGLERVIDREGLDPGPTGSD